MQRVVLAALLFTITGGMSAAQSPDMSERDGTVLFGYKGALRFQQPWANCPCIGGPDKNFMYPGFLPFGTQSGTIAQVPGLAYRDDDDPTTSSWTTTCELAGKELQGSAERFSLCNATHSGVGVEIIEADNTLDIVLGPNSFVSIRAKTGGTRVVVEGRTERYGVINGRVYSLEAALTGEVTLNQFPVP
jgi:hypothetical protein